MEGWRARKSLADGAEKAGGRTYSKEIAPETLK
jgi:hypothetical protein